MLFMIIINVFLCVFSCHSFTSVFFDFWDFRKCLQPPTYRAEPTKIYDLQKSPDHHRHQPRRAAETKTTDRRTQGHRTASQSQRDEESRKQNRPLQSEADRDGISRYQDHGTHTRAADPQKDSRTDTTCRGIDRTAQDRTARAGAGSRGRVGAEPKRSTRDRSLRPLQDGSGDDSSTRNDKHDLGSRSRSGRRPQEQKRSGRRDRRDGHHRHKPARRREPDTRTGRRTQG